MPDGFCMTPSCSNRAVPGYAYCETCLRRRGGVVGPSGPVTAIPVPTTDPVSVIALPPRQTTYEWGNENWDADADLVSLIATLKTRVTRLNEELRARRDVIQQQKGTIARLVWACGGPPAGEWLDSSPGDFAPRAAGYDLMWGKLDPETGQVHTWQWFRA